MLFVTDTFLVFFSFVFIVYWLIPYRFRVNFLIVSSIFFYATWNVAFAIHFLFVIILNYYVMEIWKIYRRKWIFYALQIVNVVNIGFFKYYYFLADVMGRLFMMDSWQSPALRELHRQNDNEILLPLAISFYTFQIMAYGIDIFRGVYTVNHTLREVVLFKSFFPQLIAGPIMRSSDLLPQVTACDRGEYAPDREKVAKGIWFVLIGIVKKVVLADFLLQTFTPLLMTSSDKIWLYDPLHLWAAMLGLMFMLYADFSAYSDMARGFGYLLGFDIPENFHAPFFMKSISDFWRRWHLTFSYWIRDYIFIPLGGNRVMEWRVYLNLIITFGIGGLWHGASYTFLLWGVGTGMLISLESFVFKRWIPEWPDKLWIRYIKLALTWIVFVPTAALFFGRSIDWSASVMGRMFYIPDFGNPEMMRIDKIDTVFYSLIAVVLFHMLEEKPELLEKIRRYEKILLPAVSLLVVLIITQFAGGQKDFFYFQF